MNNESFIHTFTWSCSFIHETSVESSNISVVEKLIGLALAGLGDAFRIWI